MKLLKMFVENFMKYENAGFDFSDVTKISGKNGVGKSSIATAYTWCLFDCDYNLKSNPAVRREVVGQPVEGDVSVTLVFDVDGKEVIVRKVQKRSGKEGTVKDTNKYFINEVPKTKKEFEEYLGINTIFRVCSNIDAFLNEKTDYVRSYLFSIAKEKSDLEIAKSVDELADLPALLENYTAEELESINRKKKTDIEKKIPVIDGQIKETERNIQLKSDTDVSDLELERNTLKEQLDENRKKQDSNAELLKSYEEATAGIMELKFKLSDIQNMENEKLSKQRRLLRNQIEEKRSEKKELERNVEKLRFDLRSTYALICQKEEERAKQAQLWNEENSRKFDENSTKCPYCEQEYPEERKEEMRFEFSAKKEAELNRITDVGTNLKQMIEKWKYDVDTLANKLDSESKHLKDVEADIVNIMEQEAQIPATADVSANKEYQEIQKQIEEKEKALAQFGDIEEMRASLRQEESNLNAQLKICEQKIMQSDTSKEEERLDELEKEKKELGQQKTDAEKILYLLDGLEKAKNEQLSDEINKHFEIVQWKLFDYAKNGSYKSVCIPMVDGKSILTTISNKGNRILGKLDICRCIQKIEGVSVPIWMDDCESLDSENQKKVMDMVDGQLIMLIVNNEEKLKVEE